MKRLTGLLLALAILLMTAVAFSDQFLDPVISGGILKWHKVDKANTYIFKVTDSCANVSDVLHLSETTTQLDLHDFIDQQLLADKIKNTGFYALYLEAYYDDTESPETLDTWVPYDEYEYHSTVVPHYDPPETVNKPLKDSIKYVASTGMLTWEPYSNLTSYCMYSVNESGSMLPDGGELKVNIHEKINYLVNHDEIAYAESFTIKVSAYRVNGTEQDSCEKTISFKPTVSPIEMTPENTTINGIQDVYSYTGAPIKPAVTDVFVDSKVLKADQDYTVAYGENIQVGNGTVTVTGKGKYKGSVTSTFQIKGADPDPIQAEISAAGILSWQAYPGATGYSVSADGTNFQTVTGLSFNLNTYIDEMISLGTFPWASSYEITLQAHDDGGVIQTWKQQYAYNSPSRVDISQAVITGIPESMQYTGAPLEPVPVVTIGSTTLVKDTDYTVAYENNVNVGTSAAVVITGTGKYGNSVKVYFAIVAPVAPPPQVVDEVTVSGCVYKLNHKEKTATLVRTANKAAGQAEPRAIKKLEIPATVKANDKSYKVTAIANNALKGQKSLTTVKIGSNVKTIGKSAFDSCKKLTTVEIGKSVATIGKSAFASCGKLKEIKVLSTKLTQKGVGAGCFKGISGKASFKLPKKMLSKYTDWFTKKGQAPKTATFSKKETDLYNPVESSPNTQTTTSGH